MFVPLQASTAATLTALRDGFDAAANQYNIRKEKKKKEKAAEQTAPQQDNEPSASASNEALNQAGDAVNQQAD